MNEEKLFALFVNLAIEAEHLVEMATKRGADADKLITMSMSTDGYIRISYDGRDLTRLGGDDDWRVSNYGNEEASGEVCGYAE